MVTTWLRRIPVRPTAVLGLAVALAACGTEAIVAPRSEEPFLYLILNQRSFSHYGGGVVQHALLVTTGSPTESPQYRWAARFDLHRASDQARFDWRAYQDVEIEPGTPDGVSLNYANYHLPEAASATGLGTADLRPGETYELEVETEGVTVRGEATIPDAFEASVSVQGDRRIAVWPEVRGGAGYLVGASPYTPELQTDTFYVIPADVPAGEILNITALDPNLYRYMTDDRVGRAGLDRGYGVFGAISTASITVPGPE